MLRSSQGVLAPSPLPWASLCPLQVALFPPLGDWVPLARGAFMWAFLLSLSPTPRGASRIRVWTPRPRVQALCPHLSTSLVCLGSWDHRKGPSGIASLFSGAPGMSEAGGYLCPPLCASDPLTSCCPRPLAPQPPPGQTAPAPALPPGSSRGRQRSVEKRSRHSALLLWAEGMLRPRSAGSETPGASRSLRLFREGN